MNNRQDFLGAACQLQGISPEEFKAAYCSRCMQSECTRSLVSASKFDHRVNTWEDRLFLNPPRMNEQDPRFASISGIKFVSVEGAAPPTSSEWVDANEVKATSIVVPSAVRSLPVLNTPVRHGIMLEGAPKAKPTPTSSSDSWDAPKGNVVKPGAKIKLGG